MSVDFRFTNDELIDLIRATEGGIWPDDGSDEMVRWDLLRKRFETELKSRQNIEAIAALKEQQRKLKEEAANIDATLAQVERELSNLGEATKPVEFKFPLPKDTIPSVTSIKQGSGLFEVSKQDHYVTYNKDTRSNRDEEGEWGDH